MDDFLCDLDARRRGDRVPAKLATLVIVRATVEDVRAGTSALGDLDGRNLEIVGSLAGGMRPEKNTVGGVGLVWSAGRSVGKESDRTGCRRTIPCQGTTGRSGWANPKRV